MVRLARPLAVVVFLGGLLLGAAGRPVSRGPVTAERRDAITSLAPAVTVPVGRWAPPDDVAVWLAATTGALVLMAARWLARPARLLPAHTPARTGRPRSPPRHPD